LILIDRKRLSLFFSVLFLSLCPFLVLSINNQLNTLLVYLGLTIAYAAFLFSVKECPSNFWLIIVLGVAYRLLPCFVATSALSNDLTQYGYLGNKIIGGQIPYKDFSAPYPPFSLYISVPFILAGDLRVLKIFFVSCDLAMIFLLYIILKSKFVSVDKGRFLSMLALFFPVSMLEYSVSGHNDSFTMLLLIASVALLDSKPAFSSISLSLAVCSKIFPVLAVPFMVKYLFSKSRQASHHFLLGLVSSLSLISAPFVLLSSSSYFEMILGTTRFSIPYGLFPTLLFALLGGASASLAIPVLIVSSVFSAVVFLLIFTYSCVHKWELFKSLSVVFVFLPFLLPQFQPWYLLWALPFVMLYFSENRKMLVGYMALLSISHFLSYAMPLLVSSV